MAIMNLTIRGLCGLVPNEPVPSEPDPGHLVKVVRVLVLDAAKLGERENLTLCAHEPRLIIDLEGSPRIFDLKQHKIEIEGLDFSEPVQLQREFWEIAQINQVTNEPVDVSNAFFLDSLLNDGIVASLRIANAIVTGFDPAPQEFDFHNGYKNKFARAVQVSLQLNQASKIHLTRFGESKPARSIDLGGAASV